MVQCSMAWLSLGFRRQYPCFTAPRTHGFRLASDTIDVVSNDSCHALASWRLNNQVDTTSYFIINAFEKKHLLADLQRTLKA